eukprot:scaffold6.g2715.t1
MESAFGVSIADLARAGRPPVVLLDALRWLSVKGGLTEPLLFAGSGRVERKKLLLLKAMYEGGRRPLRAKAAKHSAQTVAELLLLWLHSEPEPLFPRELMPALVASQLACEAQAERVAAIRALLKQTEPFIVEALYPLFEFLHHWLLNQADREGAVQELGRLFAGPVFGRGAAAGLPEGEEGLLEDTAELMILQYRPLFTQPYNLNRYEQDAARAAATTPPLSPVGSPPGAARALAAASAAAAAAARGALDLGAPLLTPLRVGQLSVVDPSGRSPLGLFEDLSPLPDLSEWDAEHAELFAGDPHMHSLMSQLLESTVSGGLGLAHAPAPAAEVDAQPARQPEQRSERQAGQQAEQGSLEPAERAAAAMEAAVAAAALLAMEVVPPVPPPLVLTYAAVAARAVSPAKSVPAGRGGGGAAAARERSLSPTGVLLAAEQQSDGSDCESGAPEQQPARAVAGRACGPAARSGVCLSPSRRPSPTASPFSFPVLAGAPSACGAKLHRR